MTSSMKSTLLLGGIALTVSATSCWLTNRVMKYYSNKKREKTEKELKELKLLRVAIIVTNLPEREIIMSSVSVEPINDKYTILFVSKTKKDAEDVKQKFMENGMFFKFRAFEIYQLEQVQRFTKVLVNKDDNHTYEDVVHFCIFPGDPREIACEFITRSLRFI